MVTLYSCTHRVDGSPLQFGVVRRDVGPDELPDRSLTGDALLVLALLEGDLPPPPVSGVAAISHRPLRVAGLLVDFEFNIHAPWYDYQVLGI